MDVLKALDGKRIGDYYIYIGELKPTRLRGAWRFTLSLKDKGGKTSTPIIRGRYFEGRGRWIRPWLEVDYTPFAKIGGSEVDLSEGLDIELFNSLSSILPPGGSIMVKYGEHLDTARPLSLNVPPAATPLGYLLWRAGFRWFKDWYFPEGWMEGEQKLQGNKPLDAEHEKRIIKRTADELKTFLEGEFNWDEELLGRCRVMAQEVLSSIEKRPF